MSTSCDLPLSATEHEDMEQKGTPVIILVSISTIMKGDLANQMDMFWTEGDMGSCYWVLREKKSIVDFDEILIAFDKIEVMNRVKFMKEDRT